MVNLNKLRLPYREDTVFSLLAFEVFLIPLAFSLFSYENFETVKVSLFFILTGAAGLVFFLKYNGHKFNINYNKPLSYLLAAFVIFASLSALFAQDHLLAFFGQYYRFTNGWIFFISWVLFLFLLWQTLTRERLEFLLKVLVFDCFVIALFVFFQGFGWIIYPGLEVVGFFRGPGLLGNTNFTAMFLVVALPIAVYFFISSANTSKKIYYALVAFWIVLANLILASRGALLGTLISFMLALILLLVFSFPKKLFFLMFVLLVAGSFFGYAFLKTSRPQAVSGIVALTDTNASSRFYAWDVSWKIIKKNPILGIGLGNFALGFAKNQFPEFASGLGIFDDAHNLFLHLAATGGLPMVFCFVGILIFTFAGALQALRKKDLLVLFLLLSLCAWSVAVNFNPVPVPMYIILGLILSGLGLMSQKNRIFSISKLVGPAIWSLSAIVLLTGSLLLVSEHFLGLSRDFYGRQDYELSQKLAKIAHVLNPTNELSLNLMAANAIEKGETAKAETAIEKIKSLHPQATTAYAGAGNLYAMLYYKNNNKEYLIKALSEMDKSLQLDPYYVDRYAQMALYFYELQDLSNAKKSLEAALLLDEKNFPSWILRAKLYQLEGNREQAIFSLEKAFHINPNIPQLKYLLWLAKNTPNIQQVPIQILSRKPSI